MEDKYKEEVTKTQKQKTLIMQRDNKITVLENKLSGAPAGAATKGTKVLQQSNVGKQKEVGNVFRNQEDRERHIIGGIRKNPTGLTPTKVHTEDTPRSILKKPNGQMKTTP